MRSIKNSKGYTTFLNSQESQLFERLEEFGPITKSGLAEREQYLLDQMRQRDIVKLVKLKDGTNAYKHVKQKNYI